MNAWRAVRTNRSTTLLAVLACAAVEVAAWYGLRERGANSAPIPVIIARLKPVHMEQLQGVLRSVGQRKHAC
jgi:hypothetical protein